MESQPQNAEFRNNPENMGLQGKWYIHYTTGLLIPNLSMFFTIEIMHSSNMHQFTKI